MSTASLDPTSPAAMPGLFARSWLRSGALVPLALVALMLGCTALQRFGLTVGDASLNAAHFGAYFLLVAALLSGRLTIHGPRLAAYCALLALGGLSWMVNDTLAAQDGTSPTSFALLAMMYLPFVFMLRPGAAGHLDTEWILRAFANVGLFCAFAGILQFAAQFVIRADWLFDFSPYLPPWLRSSGGYNTVIPAADGLFKSNGFFFKEPSLFSLAVAFTLLLEIGRFRRWWRMAVLVLALMLTYSGSGLLVLAFGLLFPLRVRTFLRLGAVALVGGIAVFLLWDVLNLDFTLGRVAEFAQPRSSAHMRYVAPAHLIAESLFQHPWTFWIGFGPGTIYRTGGHIWGWFYEYHDPTLAKLLFEYGMLGLVLSVTLVVLTLRNAAIPIQVRAAAFFCWIGTGGFLLTPELTYLMIIFGLLLQPQASVTPLTPLTPASPPPAPTVASTSTAVMPLAVPRSGSSRAPR
jgi:hypothetical protein